MQLVDWQDELPTKWCDVARVGALLYDAAHDPRCIGQPDYERGRLRATLRAVAPLIAAQELTRWLSDLDYQLNSMLNANLAGDDVELLKLLTSDLCARLRELGNDAHDEETKDVGGQARTTEAVGTAAEPRLAGAPEAPAEAPTEEGRLTYVVGDATLPRGIGVRYVAHVCNDRGGWGRGFSGAVSRRWPEPEREYRALTPNERVLGLTQFVHVGGDIVVVNLIAQRGYATSHEPVVLDYVALRDALTELRDAALEANASVHVPRLGCGLAGGDWTRVERLLRDQVAAFGVPVTVYELPATRDLDRLNQEEHRE